jgi:hypothetical protein
LIQPELSVRGNHVFVAKRGIAAFFVAKHVMSGEQQSFPAHFGATPSHALKSREKWLWSA